MFSDFFKEQNFTYTLTLPPLCKRIPKFGILIVRFIIKCFNLAVDSAPGDSRLALLQWRSGVNFTNITLLLRTRKAIFKLIVLNFTKFNSFQLIYSAHNVLVKLTPGRLKWRWWRWTLARCPLRRRWGLSARPLQRFPVIAYWTRAIFITCKLCWALNKLKTICNIGLHTGDKKMYMCQSFSSKYIWTNISCVSTFLCHWSIKITYSIFNFFRRSSMTLTQVVFRFFKKKGSVELCLCDVNNGWAWPLSSCFPKTNCSFAESFDVMFFWK